MVGRGRNNKWASLTLDAGNRTTGRGRTQETGGTTAGNPGDQLGGRGGGGGGGGDGSSHQQVSSGQLHLQSVTRCVKPLKITSVLSV
jgi:hypothetical protein